MDLNDGNNAPSRGQGLPKPHDAPAGTQGQIAAPAAHILHGIPINQPTPASEWSFTPGPYDRRGYYIPPQAVVHQANSTPQGPSSAEEPNRQPPGSSSTRFTAPGKTADGVTQPHRRVTELPFVLVYLSIAGPPLSFHHQVGWQPNVAAWVGRAQLSAAWQCPSVRAVLWGNLQTRKQLFHSCCRPPEPMSFEDSKKVMLNDVRLILRQELTQDEFWKMVRTLYPDAPGSPYHVSEWAIGCATCGKEVLGYASDTLWIERYLSHRKHACVKTPEGRRA
ncbi:hypothetical protein HYPSUDRAFT_207393 [Hypholoma sublateritium FD-334 SS-4]|uniref:Uncharacterized protein n=1 Tax=Hypholoma sublateritium (strain FD-334 SS-4) TaxID=945553 RepID=A0A0D2NA24_HYPSF|nr:hypothetical protein HYPSUDRAFT_207393 [Hypholoma sublateritium FD-334 SS-4]